MTIRYGNEFFQGEDDECGWVCRDEGITRGQAKQIASSWWETDYTDVRCQAVFMRTESEVEAKINHHEFPYMTECTTRARDARAFWRLWMRDHKPLFLQARERNREPVPADQSGKP